MYSSKDKSLTPYQEDRLARAEGYEERAADWRGIRSPLPGTDKDIKKAYLRAAHLRTQAKDYRGAEIDLSEANKMEYNPHIAEAREQHMKHLLLLEKQHSLRLNNKLKLSTSRRHIGSLATASILIFIAALFFLSFNFTGAVIGNASGSAPAISPQGSLGIGLGLIIAGVALALVYFREKDSEKKSLVRKGSARIKK